jgi:hypothetical protein
MPTEGGYVKTQPLFLFTACPDFDLAIADDLRQDACNVDENDAI